MRAMLTIGLVKLLMATTFDVAIDSSRLYWSDPLFFIPAEFKSAGSAALDMTQASCRQFGNAILIWPEIWDQAVEIAPYLPLL
jgi:hypothetical protein